MLKALSFALVLTTCSLALTAAPRLQQEDKSVHHAAMHTEHWVNNHASPHRSYRRRRHDKSVHHTAMHAEHWIKHHASAPHKGGGR